MANIKKDVTITPVTITKKRNKFTGQNFNSNPDVVNGDTISINYDVMALNSSDVEIFKYSQGVITIPASRFGETLIANFLAAGQALIISELPNS